MKYLRPATPTLAEPSSTGGRRNDHPVLQPPLIQVSDQLERRIRKPADALRCVVACIVIIAAVVTAIAASATTAGAEIDIVGASKRLPDALANDIPQIARFGLLILPLALAATQLVRRQVRRLVEAFATGVWRRAAAEVANILLERPAAARLYYAIIMAHAGHQPRRCPRPLSGRPGRLRHDDRADRAAWLAERAELAIGVYVVVQLAASTTTHVSVAHDPDYAAGRLRDRPAVRYGAGSASQRPSATGDRRGAVHQAHRAGQARQGPDGDRDPAGSPAARRCAGIAGTTR